MFVCFLKGSSSNKYAGEFFYTSKFPQITSFAIKEKTTDRNRFLIRHELSHLQKNFDLYLTEL